MKNILIGLVILLLNSQTAFAHPGRTAADGCHYCRTNCSKWGEVQDQRHCHGGAVITTPSPTPTPTIIKTPTPTKKPTVTPTIVVTTPISSPTPTPIQEEPVQSEVLGDEDTMTKPTAESQSEEKTTNSNGAAWLIVLGAAGLVGYQYQKQRKQA